MKKWLRRIGTSVVVLCLVAVLWVFRPYPSVDRGKLASEVLALGEDPTITGVSYLMDGGSFVVGMKGNGKEVAVCLRAPMGEPDAYQSIVVNGIRGGEEGAYRLKEPMHTRLFVLELLRDYELEGANGRYKDMVIGECSGRWSDKARFLYRQLLTRKYDF